MILIIGSGVAGLSCALAAVDAAAGHDIEVELVAAGEFDGCNTALAQGGVAAAVGSGDSAAAHLADTLAVGCGIVDREAANQLVRDGAAQMQELLAAGFPADRGAHGELLLGLEAAHSAARIVHGGGDRSGAVLHEYLLGRARSAEQAGLLTLRSGYTAVSLIEESGQVSGAVLRASSGDLTVRRADTVVLATGGYAGLFPRTSNHASSRGEGIVLAAGAGALIADLEFVQFHPTVLHGTGQLISEAVRGAGAVLRDGAGKRFMPERSPLAELAPRDVVSREIHRLLRERGEGAVWLDATGIETECGAGTLRRRFPGITAATTGLGYDWAHEPVPVSPAAHYSMGGIASDLDGRSTVPGLFVAGEASSTGVHGANRLASNSLLEGMVFGTRAGIAAVQFVRGAGNARAWELRGKGMADLVAASDIAMALPAHDGAVQARDAAQIQIQAQADLVAHAISTGLGIERDAAGLEAVPAMLGGFADADATLACMIAYAAAQRTESRGAHQRADFRDTDASQAARRAYRFVPEATPRQQALNSARTPGVAVGVPATDPLDVPSISRSLASCSPLTSSNL